MTNATQSESAEFVRQLEADFFQSGFRFEQVRRERDVAIYRKSRAGYSGYEVIRIRARPAESFRGRHCPKREVYPFSEQWGVNGFTCAVLEAAQARFRSLLEMPRIAKLSEETGVF